MRPNVVTHPPSLFGRVPSGINRVPHASGRAQDDAATVRKDEKGPAEDYYYPFRWRSLVPTASAGAYARDVVGPDSVSWSVL